MIYTNEEAAIIDGMIGTLFGGANVAENVRDAYQTVRRHLTEDSLDQKDLSRISAAIDFSLKNQFCRLLQQGKSARFDNDPHQNRFLSLNPFQTRVATAKSCRHSFVRIPFSEV